MSDREHVYFVCLFFFFFSNCFYDACIALSDSDSVPEPDSFLIIT